jgi:hypothetical protein
MSDPTQVSLKVEVDADLLKIGGLNSLLGETVQPLQYLLAALGDNAEPPVEELREKLGREKVARLRALIAERGAVVRIHIAAAPAPAEQPVAEDAPAGWPTTNHQENPMAIRAKFMVHSVTKFHGGGEAIHAQPVYGDSPENKTWSQYTPSGELRLAITNPDACGQLAPAQEFYVDITPIPKG